MVNSLEASDPTSAALAGSSSRSQQDELSSLIARATAAYAIKDYSPAAELYSQATELQAEINGEMAVENADLLYSYGKCLYFVAVSKSDVLGGGAAGAKLGKEDTPAPKKGAKRKANGVISKAEAGEEVSGATVTGEKDAHIVEDAAVALVEDSSNPTRAHTNGKQPAFDSDNKPYFQFTGDENWDDSGDEDNEDAAADEEDDPEEEEDDFVNAYEVLDLARVLLLRKLENLQASAVEVAEKGSEEPATAWLQDETKLREVKERVADVHDLQAEIALEGEKFLNAVVDLKASLALKQELYPDESSVLAECHYKLSLALEFSSVTQQHDPIGNPIGEAVVDEKVREEAAQQMEKAIRSCKLRIGKEQRELRAIEKAAVTDSASAATEKTSDQVVDTAADIKIYNMKRQIADVKEMVADMEQRLLDLRKPPVDVTKEATKGDLEALMSSTGILGQILGGGARSEDEQKKLLDEASKAAKDLSAFVKRKGKTSTNNYKAGERQQLSSANGESSLSSSTLTDQRIAYTAIAGTSKGNSNENNVGIGSGTETGSGSSKGKRKMVEFADEVEEIVPPTTGKKAKIENNDNEEEDVTTGKTSKKI